MVRGLIDAWSLEPLGVLRLGDREFPVPPLTLGRFQRLLGLDTEALTKGLLAEYKTTPPRSVRVMRALLRLSILRGLPGRRLMWWAIERFHIGHRLYRAASAADAVGLVVPGVTPSVWKEHGSQLEFSKLFLLFADGHDWAYIANAIRFGEPVEEGEELPDPDDIAQGLIAVAKETGHSVEQLATMRLEGFYRLVAALRAKAEAQEDAVAQSRHPQGGPLPGVEYVDEIPEELRELIRKAREGTDG